MAAAGLSQPLSLKACRRRHLDDVVLWKEGEANPGVTGAWDGCFVRALYLAWQ